jgi:hypothetical protein
MGTHAMIGFYNQEDGSVEASYVHYDGYVEGVGCTLVNAYNTFAKAKAVASVGYLSSLEEDLDSSIAASVHKNEPTVPYESVDQFMKNGYDYCGAHYLYLFDGEVWFYATRGSERRFEEVEMNLKAAA